MPTPRAHSRSKKRLKVITSNATFFTVDASVGGFCVESGLRVSPGTSLSGVVLMNGTECAFEGVVAWRAEGDVRLGERGRFGVRFVRAPNLSMAAPAPRAPVVIAAPVARAAVAPASPASMSSTNDYSLTQEGDVWVVRLSIRTGRPQEYRCAKESQARQLLAAMTSH